ncbi:MAG: GNAT family N-acetyltransferase [Planctomycetota bacterium]
MDTETRFTDLRLRHAVTADTKDLVRVHFDVVHGSTSGSYPVEVHRGWSEAPDDSRRRTDPREAIERGEDLFAVAEISYRIAGFGSIVPAIEELRAMYVDPAFGGSAVLRRLEDEASRLGLSALRMDASLNAESFYARHGYEIIQRGVHRLAAGVDMPCVTMRKPIVADHD